MLAATKALGNRSLVSRLEVERKFAPSSLLKKYASETSSTTPRILLAATTNHGPHVTLSRQPLIRITDKYFDYKGQLEHKGIWVRWRKTQVTTPDGLDATPPQTHWEAKVKQGGEFLNSQFVEAKGRDAVEALMAEAGVCDSIYDLEFQLGFVADRVSWIVDGFTSGESDDDAPAMTLVLDTMSSALEGRNGEFPKSMHHQVGELELEKTITTSLANEDVARDVARAEKGARHHAARAIEGDSMRKQLVAFMAAYPSLLETGVSPIGKITAYMQRKELLASRAKKANATGRLANMSEVQYERLISGM